MNGTALIAELASIVGNGAVRTDDAALKLAASDVHVTGQQPAAVIRPMDAATLAAAVAACTRRGFAVIPRGGGLSYTGGYAPPCAMTVTVDMGGMNRILAIAEDDMTITVQAGTTWKQIETALKPLGLRLPFIGTFSGAGATVGGGLGHGALFFGSARYGSAAEIVLQLEVALADGSLLRTGQGALAVGAKPILRTFGPDLTGLFTHDGGMLGIKTEATFRLIRRPAWEDYASFAFTSIEQAADALSEIARADLSEEVYILDPSAASAVHADVATMSRTAMSVLSASGGPVRAVKALASLFRGRHGIIPDNHFSLHLTAAGRSAAAVQADIASATRIAIAQGGFAVEPIIPRVARAELFANLNGVVGAHGGRWAALNAKVAHSDARALIAAFDAMIAPHRSAMAAHGVRYTRLISALSNHCFSFEPVYHWRDAWLPLHQQAPDPNFLAHFTDAPANPEARALVDQLRHETTDLFRRLGAASNQIGRTYPFRSALSAGPEALLSTIKRTLDPNGMMNPGVLGFP